jgi:hypothetical protein
MTKIVMNLETVSPEVAIWLKQANDKHYYIERLPKRQGARIDRFPISIEFAERLQVMSDENAWFAIEKYVGASPL